MNKKYWFERMEVWTRNTGLEEWRYCSLPILWKNCYVQTTLTISRSWELYAPNIVGLAQWHRHVSIFLACENWDLQKFVRNNKDQGKILDT